jgi:6-phosphogluconolactonase
VTVVGCRRLEVPPTVVREDVGMESLLEQGARLVASHLDEAISSRGIAHLVLTGGGAGSALADVIAGQDRIDWAKVHVWWGDERFLPRGDAERNDVQVRRALARMVGAHLHHISAPGEGDPAAQYAEALRSDLGDHSFDVVLLGIGADGHVASLFPGTFDPHDPLSVKEVRDAPKPPAHRVTLTIPRLTNARHVLLIATGEAKRAAIAAARNHDHALPVGWIEGIESTLLLTDLGEGGGS